MRTSGWREQLSLVAQQQSEHLAAHSASGHLRRFFSQNRKAAGEKTQAAKTRGAFEGEALQGISVPEEGREVWLRVPPLSLQVPGGAKMPRISFFSGAQK